MRGVSGSFLRISIIVCCLLAALECGNAQKKPVETQNSARMAVIEKARTLESRGRPDMAVQLWQQILLSEPNNAEALAGLARDYKLMGAADKANDMLNRLRRVNPNDPNIASIQALASTQSQSEELKRAGDLARQGRADEAMQIYRQLYGDHPPDNVIGTAYYQTLFATATGKAVAVAGMRVLAGRHPGDATFAVALGTMLTYDPRTRAEGIRILQVHQGDPEAEAALRRALLWNSANPASAAELRQYLKSHPLDTEVARNLRTNEAKLAQMNSGIARTPAERAAFAALNAHRLDDAEARFNELLRKDPKNGRVAAGMGFLRMQQRNFGGAISYLTDAEQNGYKSKAVNKALETSRFWYTMSEATDAFNQNKLDVAEAKYKAALVMNARSPEALNGLAGLLLKQHRYAPAVGVYSQLIAAEPNNAEGWRGLFLAYAQDKQNEKALGVETRFPAAVKTELARDPEYLGALASVYQAMNRDADAERVLAQALTLPFPANGATLKADTKMQYAGILMAARRYDQAIGLYTQITAENPANVSAWMGLISAEHALGRDTAAIQTVEKMPSATYEAALVDPNFLSELGAIYQQANQYEVAQGLLERAAKLDAAQGRQPGVALQLQLAAIYLLRNNTDQAFAIYRQVIASHPDSADAWKGLIGTLLATNRYSEALQELALIPAATRKELENDVEFEQSEAGLYAATGDVRTATLYMNRVQAHYARLRRQPPASIDVENAWLLYNTGNDRGLYAALMCIGGRNDLTPAQHETIENIWANWSVRRAAEAMENGNMGRAVDILDAALQAFPENLAVRKAVAGGYARVGRAREAVKLFKTVPMQDASTGDFEGAISAALAANDRTQAEAWLRQALERYGRDPGILELAARFEQARGDNQRAAEYWRAALAVMPATTPADKLAHELVYPEQDTRAHRAVTAADLQHLLDPDYEPFPKTSKLPALPAYGPDPYDGHAPVTPAAPQSSEPQATPGTNPAITAIPTLQPSGQQLFHQQSAMHLAGDSAWTMRDGVYHPPMTGSAQTIRPLRLSYGENGRGELRLASYGQSQSAQPWSDEAVPIVANPPHSMSSDAYKGLIFSLMAAHRNAEALQELARIPAATRRELESGLEFVQGVASLYIAVQDVARATAYLERVDNYYVIHRTQPPAGLEVQRAWLLYNLNRDAALYPVMLSLDGRADLTAEQRTQVNTLWANWAVRRAQAAIDGNNLRRGVEILQAASQDYPDDMGVRRAVAGAYLKTGRAAEAEALFKTIPMDDAGPANYQGAISAALAARDMAQAEAWLRQALTRYPGNAKVLALAAHFEQAKGDKQRAAQYWKAALSAMPPGTPSSTLDDGLGAPIEGYRAPAPGDTKRLLDPRYDRVPASGQSPLPHYAAPVVPVQPVRSDALPVPVAQPQFVEQSAGGTATSRSAGGTPFAGGHLSEPGAYEGQVSLPPSERTVDSDESQTASQPATLPKLRITAQPVGDAAAQAQAQFAARTDSQLTEGSASAIHTLGNAPVSGPAVRPALPAVEQVNPAWKGEYTTTQYTPSAQEAATGAYSAPRPSEKPSAASATTTTTPPAKRHKKSAQASRKAVVPAAPAPPFAPPLSSAPAAPAPAVAAENPQPEAAPQEPQSTSGTGLTDDELEQRNLPPLRGPWIRMRRQPNPMSPREEAELQLRSIESGYSGWFGGTGLLNYRSGALGYDHLAALEAPFEVSLPMGTSGRFTVVAKPVFLDSGQADGSATMAVIESSTAGSGRVTIPEPIGTLTTTDTNPPAQQNATGVGGEVQLAFPQAAIAGGYTPYGFLVATFTARGAWRPGNGPVVFSVSRDPVRDSQLSYAGLRDPAGTTLGHEGQIWGGVIANQGNIQVSHGDAQSGYYFSVGGQYLTGYNVESNTRVDGDAGAWWRAWTQPEYGTLSVGVNFFGMHYANNENAFTRGMGGYFSPQAYFLANVPFTYTGHYLTNWHYSVVGGFGVQAFQEDKTPLWPLAGDRALETANFSVMLPDQTSVGANYDLHGEAAYQISPHWFAGGFFSANNTRDYNAASVGFSIHYMFRSQPSTANGPTGLFPVDGLRPFTVP